MPTRTGKSFYGRKCDTCGEPFAVGHALTFGPTSGAKTALELMGIVKQPDTRRTRLSARVPYYRQYDRRR
jgi:hypothetical protein